MSETEIQNLIDSGVAELDAMDCKQIEDTAWGRAAAWSRIAQAQELMSLEGARD